MFRRTATLVLTLAALPAGAAVVLRPSADTFVSSARPAGSFGTAGALAVSAAGLPRGEFQTLLRFDASAAAASFDALYGPNNWRLTSAALSLLTQAPNNAAFNTANAAGAFAVTWTADDGWAQGTGSPSAPGAD